MSAMLEAYDMPMLDYPTDLDIQMHLSSSDQWFPDESQMEEDAPGVLMKTENYSPPKSENHLQMKTDTYTQDKSEVTIEVDMEPFSEHQNDEYEMQDGEEVHDLGETQDVEVYDVSLAQSPFMAASVDVSQDVPANFLGPFDHTNSPSHSHNTSPIMPHSSELPPLETRTLEASLLDSISTSGDGQLETREVHEIQPDTKLEEDLQPEPSRPTNVQESEIPSEEGFSGSHPHEDPLLNHEKSLESLTNLPETEIPEGFPAEDEGESARDEDTHDQDIQPECDVHPTSENSVGDPHEISEGVYIDPPPPVLLSVASEDQFDFSFFNESPDRITSHSSGLVFLRHFPTLYYEPLSAVFDALREEEFVQSMFHLAESELVLDAVDLQLTISEDNVYAREVALHDLNVLHDVSGINGLLRMRLYASAPRFITRYQHLQDQVSRLNLEHPSIEVPPENNGQGEINREDHVETHEEKIHEEEQPIDNSIADSFKGVESPLRKTDDQEEVEEGVGSVAPSADHDPESYLPPLPAENNEVDQDGEETHDDVGSKAPAAESYISELYLPPLPAEYEEDIEEGEASVPQDNLAQLPSGGNDLESFDYLPTSEVGPATGDLSSSEDIEAAVVSLEAPTIAETGPYVEEQHEEEAHEAHEEEAHKAHEEEGYERYEGKVREIHEEEHVEQGHTDNEFTEGEHAENEITDEGHAEEEIFEDAFYQEDTTSHSAGDDLDYVEEEEVDTKLETDTLETLVGDFDYAQSTNQDGIGENSTDLGSGNRQGSGADYVSIPDSNEPDKETEAPPELDNYTNLEDEAEFEPANVWESSTDPTVQETYAWEEDPDGENGPDTPWEGQHEKALSNSNHSSVTLSSKTSKRSFDELDVDDGLEDESGQWSPPSSPDPKRSRTQ